MTTQTVHHTLSSDAPSTNDGLLRNTMRANAVFSGIFALLFIMASVPVAEFLGIAEASILGIMSGATFIGITGILLAINAIEIGYITITSRPRIPRWYAWRTIILDELWVIGSAVLIFANALPFTTAGSWAVFLVADAVLIFAVVQYIGLRRMNKAQ